MEVYFFVYISHICISNVLMTCCDSPLFDVSAFRFYDTTVKSVIAVTHLVFLGLKRMNMYYCVFYL